ncbi:hypothetical protein BRADI_4g39287v3 [Brachypodium distachyon]|nr:hypothetical protein BRADI_4g39287v3 [Brachypodium distachyon]
MEMLLRALRAHRKVRTANTKEELEKLAKAPDRTDLPAQVMIFCYSMLSRSYKSCFQYMCAFRDETAISRTSLVRRWVAEGLVEKQDGRSLEEAAELCFQELLFRGFLLPHHRGDAGKVKSCKIDDTVWEFAYRMSASENFVSSLPTYLSYQLRIRKFVKEQEKELEKNPRPQEVDSHRSICRFRRRPRDDTKAMDDMVSLLGTLPQGYRLNVLDLGGCRGLKKRHLNSICNVHSLKYLSLRNTAGVCRLPRGINKLRLLETLDIRQTELQQQDTERICLPNLKHLLTGTKMTDNDKEPLYAGSIPSKIGKMRDMEILSWVQVQEAQELENVSHLQHLRKLGVVLGGKGSEAQDNMNKLLHAITQMEYLRSLSIWVTPPPTNGNSDSALKMEMTEQHLIIAPKILQSLHISGISLAQTGLPSWILQPQLSEITLCNTWLSKESLQKLGTNLPRLCCLRLHRNSYNDCKLTFNKDGFKALKFLIIQGDKVTTVEFEEEGTTPLLEKIVWRNMSLDHSGSFSGIHHLAGKLEEVELKGLFNVGSIEAWSGCKVSYDLEVPFAK